jgi:excisionase family DNA binding protein
MGSPKTPPSDLCWGAAAIAEVLGLSERKVYWLLENNLIPGRKIGRSWCASRARLLAYCAGDDIERGSS